MASILLIDDDRDLLNVTAAILRQAGHIVDTAPDGKTGLALYRAGRHDLIITDIVMPDMEGLEVITGLRHAAPRPRIIAISGDSKYSKSLYLPTARQLGAQRALAKPIRPEMLLQTVAEVLAEPPPPTSAPPAS
ncbi:MAG: response regulator [Verrucomicrobia bacterium]|nr:response regulator [Verrucomicrobiota bacterium]